MELSQLVNRAELVMIMECQVCQEIPLPPIYMCTTGHNICKACKPKLPNCPVCKKPWVQTRNFSMEAIIRASKHACPNRGEGCRDEPTGDQMENHLTTCEFRSFVCPLNQLCGCQMNTLKLSETLEHMLDKHKAIKSPDRMIEGVCKLSRKLMFNFNQFVDNKEFVKNLFWTPVILDFDQKSFLVHGYTLGNTMRWAVLHIGREETSRIYCAKLTLDGGKKSEISWIVPVQSVMIGSLLLSDTNMERSLVANCNPQTIKQVAERDEKNSAYFFNITYEITKY